MLTQKNICKAYDLIDSEFALISEAVTPEFEYEDMNMPSITDLELDKIGGVHITLDEIVNRSEYANKTIIGLFYI